MRVVVCQYRHGKVSLYVRKEGEAAAVEVAAFKARINSDQVLLRVCECLHGLFHRNGRARIFFEAGYGGHAYDCGNGRVFHDIQYLLHLVFSS